MQKDSDSESTSSSGASTIRSLISRSVTPAAKLYAWKWGKQQPQLEYVDR